MNKITTMQEVLTSLRQVSLIHDKILTMSGQYFDGEKLIMREAHFAVAIGENSSLTMGQLADKLQVTPGAVSQMAKHMEEKGFVCRVADKEDKRVNKIALTEKGERLYREHMDYDKEQYSILTEYFEEFSVEELKTIVNFNQKLYTAFRDLVEKS